MRYFKNEPTKLTLGTHHYTPTKDTFFKSSNKEPFAVSSRKHNYVPPTAGSFTKTSSTSARYLRFHNSLRKHSYIPTVGPGAMATASAVKRNPSTKLIPSFTPTGKNLPNHFLSPQSSPTRKLNIPSVFAPNVVEENHVAGEENKEVQETKEPEVSHENKEMEELAARKLQAFMRGALCRARVSAMLLRLIEGLLAEKEQRKRDKLQKQQEEKEQSVDEEWEEVGEVTPSSKQDIFAALDNDQVKEELAEKEIQIEPTQSILKSSESDKSKNLQKEGRSINFVDKEDQVYEIERAEEYARLPEWWMDYAPHGTLRDDEIDEKHAVLPPTQWIDDEKEEEQKETTALLPAALSVPESSEMEAQLVPREQEPVADEIKSVPMEQLESETEVTPIPAVELSALSEPIFTADLMSEPPRQSEPAPLTARYKRSNDTQVLPRKVDSTPPKTEESRPSVSPAVAVVGTPKPTTGAKLISEPVDPSTMSLAERMKAFQKGPKTSVKKNFRASTFR